MVKLLFLLVGDPFLCAEKRKEIFLSLEKEYGHGLPLTVRRAGEVEIETLLAEARTLPFLANAQVFSLREADGFTKSDWEKWDSYFKSPSPNTFLIFEAESLPKNHSLFDWARSRGKVFFLKQEEDRLVRQFIREKLKEAGKQIIPDALELLESWVGDSFLFLNSILDQLVLSVGEGTEINRTTVEALEERLAPFEGFDLIQALVERNGTKALEILEGLLAESGEDPTSLIGLLHWQLRRFWEAKRLVEQGTSERELLARLRIPPTRASFFLKQLRKFSFQELERILGALFELDWQLKTGRAEGRPEVERWLIEAVS